MITFIYKVGIEHDDTTCYVLVRAHCINAALVVVCRWLRIDSGPLICTNDPARPGLRLWSWRPELPGFGDLLVVRFTCEPAHILGESSQEDL